MTEHVSLEDVFKLSGVPALTFVEPVEYPRLKVALRTAGRGVVVEGPSKIGKTSAVSNALAEIDGATAVLTLSARRQDDVELIKELPTMANIGVVVIDDFHRLDQPSRAAISDFMKLLADEERVDSKVIVIGINKAGESLIALAPDLGGRIEVIKLGVNPEDRIARLIEKGERALNVKIDAAEEIVAQSQGSFNIAQALCHDACLTAEVTEGAAAERRVDASFELIRERVLDRLSATFQRRAEVFSKGKKLRREGRAPYLQILRWLSQSEEWTIDLQREMARHPKLRGSVGQVVEKGHLANLLDEKADELSDLLHYDEESKVLAVEDPQFFFYIRNLPWNRFAKRLGYFEVSFSSTYDFALSFAGADRDVASLLHDGLTDHEFSVFYDHNEQSRILAANVEEYLAPIYRSEATYVIALMGRDYPDRVWTKFESSQFADRFGENAVIPVWFQGLHYSAFDTSRQNGGYTLDRSTPLEPQIDALVRTLVGRITEYKVGLSGSEPADVAL